MINVTDSDHNQNSLAATTIAFYLPQYHPIPENDLWWEPGFTEWTNVTKARPLFRGHKQPNLPAELGFYDLRVPETRAQQAALAAKYGVSAFCYYHYWFGNRRRLLERPFSEVLSTGDPDFPFMLCWANQTWSGVWHGAPNRVLIEQQYPGWRDHEEHFANLLPAFRDPRYVRIENKPVFMIYAPENIPRPNETIEHWQTMAKAAGLEGIFFLAEHPDPFWNPGAFGFDAYVNVRRFPRRQSSVPYRQPIKKVRQKVSNFLRRPTVYDYGKWLDHFIPSKVTSSAIPCVIPNWDNTPRSGRNGIVFKNSSPELFCSQVEKALVRNRQNAQSTRLLFIKSWNEWAEGNYLEPDRLHGRAYLEALAKGLKIDVGFAE